MSARRERPMSTVRQAVVRPNAARGRGRGLRVAPQQTRDLASVPAWHRRDLRWSPPRSYGTSSVTFCAGVAARTRQGRCKPWITNSAVKTAMSLAAEARKPQRWRTSGRAAAAWFPQIRSCSRSCSAHASGARCRRSVSPRRRGRAAQRFPSPTRLSGFRASDTLLAAPGRRPGTRGAA